MIALQSTYGRNLIVTKDTVITYTLAENRKIAIIFKQGEYDAALCKTLKNIVVQQDTLIDNIRHTLYLMTTKENIYKQSIIDCESANKDLIKDLKKYMKRSSNWAKIGGTSIGLNILFIVLLILV